MICDIGNHYQKDLQHFKEDMLSVAEENADGDYEIYASILHSFDREVERQVALCREPRKILFCSIFSYYESMLNEIARYYKIHSKAQQVQQLYERITKEYRVKYSEVLCINLLYTNDFYRLLRNHFMHGGLSDEKDKAKLYSYVDAADGVKLYGNCSIEIEENIFLLQSLENTKITLVSIEKAFSKKVSEDWILLKRAKEIVFEAIKLYPPEYSGLEDEYPPYCSIKAHKLLLQAEQMYISLSKRENAEAQMLLADLYLSAFETPNKKKGMFWLNKAVQQKYKPAIQMLKDFNGNKEQ